MKKLIILLLIMVIILTSCNNVNKNDNNPPNTNDKPTELFIENYFPFTENTKYVYEGEGNEYASFTVFTDYITDNRIQTRTNNGGTELVKVIENNNNQLKLLLSRGETYFREDFTKISSTAGDILLKEPLTAGNSWITGDDVKRSITNVDIDVTIPLGTYKAIEVTSEGKDYKTIDYYAKDIGLIKTIETSKGYEVSSTLSRIETDAPLVQNINIYYPNIEENILNSMHMEVSFNTNDNTKDVIEKNIKDIAAKSQILSTNAKINSLYLNENGMVYVDFSKEFISEMNAGSAYEAMILQSITNTIGMYYGVEEVYITIDGKPYESGHILMKEGEAFKVNFENVKPLE